MRSRSEYLFVCLLFACLVLFFFYGSICSKEGRTSCSRKKKPHTQTANTCPLDLNLSSWAIDRFASAIHSNFHSNWNAILVSLQGS